MTNILETDRERLNGLVRREQDDASVAAFADLARDLRLWLLAGSLALKGTTGQAGQSLAAVFAGRERSLRAMTRSICSTSICQTARSSRESAAYEAGGPVPLVPLPFAVLGLTICYDVRFPHLYRKLAQGGGEVLTVPSAFTKVTGEAHWHVLLARSGHRDRQFRAGAGARRPARMRPGDFWHESRGLADGAT